MKSRHRVAVSGAAVVLLAASYVIGRWWFDRPMTLEQPALDPVALQQQAAALKHTGRFEDAALEFEKSGTPDSQFNLAMLHQNGLGVPEDRAKALALLQSAAERGSAAAQTVLGTKYAQGDGIARNDAEAAQWYEKAASQGYVWAQVLLGLAYQSGQGVPKDPVQAYKWFVLAAAAGDSNAIKERDFMAAEMPESQILDATKQANSLAERMLAGRTS